MTSARPIVVRGARQHNLKNISCDIPRNQLVVITGPSGSGKSSLAFDTIYAEGQRRYVESLSAYARQFLEQLAKPAVERIDGLSPSIAIDQRRLAKNPRSTVGTVTEISDYLRLLFARAGVPHCPQCGKVIEAQTVQQIVDDILALGEGVRCMILAPLRRGYQEPILEDFARLRRDGFVRARVNGEVIDLGMELSPSSLPWQPPYDLDVVVDRISLREGVKGRVTDSVELALELGAGRLLVDDLSGAPPVWKTEKLCCIDCNIVLPALEPRVFSFNSPHGACPACSGLGTRTRIDPERVVPNPALTLREGAIAAWGERASRSLTQHLTEAVRALKVDPDTPFDQLAPNLKQQLLYGTAPTSKRKNKYVGIITRLEHLLNATDSDQDQDDNSEEPNDGGIGADAVDSFAITTTCDACEGKRLRPEALCVRLGGRNIADLSSLSIEQLLAELPGLLDAGPDPRLSQRQRAIAEPLLRVIIARLEFLVHVGLDYLTLERSTQSLSSGEGQRIRLATQIGAALVGVLYVLDEPSIGLHAKDNVSLLQALQQLVSLGNSVIVVEHERDTILAADHIIDMGPAAGVHGGYIVAEGTAEQLKTMPASVTGPYLSGEKRVHQPTKRRRPGKQWLRIVGARAHNLKNITVDFPLGLMIAVTGVSGSGKSTLVIDTLLQAARSSLYRTKNTVGTCDRIEGLEHIDKVIAISQAPIGHSPRSNPATYTGVFALLRELYASLPEARARGYKAGRFSFNVKGGRCEACRGDGVLRVEMHFLPDVFVQCDACAGRRYNRETLEVHYRGLSIADALDLTVAQAAELFEPIPRIRERLDALLQVGLGYIQLGQASTTLSGGEAQRIKLARELARRSTGRTLYVLDEPTTGLHFSDIDILLKALLALRDAGNTLIIIEHNLDVVACADWVIDIGPQAGARGGEVIAQGTPKQVCACSASVTGPFLKNVLV